VAERRSLPRLLAVSDRAARRGGDAAAWFAALAAAGVDGLQVREKDSCDGEVYALAIAARRALPRPSCVVVNGRADIALAADLDGVHLPADGVPVAALRRRFGPRLLIGRSTHRPEEVAAAAAEGADYVTFGPVYEVPAKSGHGSPAGVDALRAAARQGLPVYALGGIASRHFPELAAAGAAGAAGIRLFHDAAGTAAAVAAARACFSRP
jgi:thiamine-phosphate pyrophosphorylase